MSAGISIIAIVALLFRITRKPIGLQNAIRELIEELRESEKIVDGSKERKPPSKLKLKLNRVSLQI